MNDLKKVDYKAKVEKKGLICTLTVTLPATQIQEEFNIKLNELTNKIQLPGFRPGRVPVKVVRQKYEGSLLQEVVGDFTQQSFDQACSENKLELVARPELSYESYSMNADIVYVAKFEILPDVELIDFSKCQLNDPQGDVSDKDIQNELKEQKEKQPDWNPVKRASKKGDQITLDFKGYLDGESFEGGDSEGYKFVLGAGTMLPDFEKNIKNKKAGDAYTFKMTFPKDYQAEKLQGKNVEFAIHIHAVEEPKEPKLDEAFFKRVGAKATTEDGFMKELKEAKEKELSYLLNRIKKSYFTELVDKKFSFELPQSMLDEELKRLEKSHADWSEKKRKSQAESNVRSSLVMKAVVAKYDIQLDQKRLDGYIQDIAIPQMDAQMFMNWYKQDEARMQQAQSVILEQQVVDKVYELVKRKTVKMNVPEAEKIISKMEK